MTSTILSCPICYFEYSEEGHLPRLIPGCGHTVCTQCLTLLLERPDFAKCPLDNRKFSFEQNNLECFPINYIVKQLSDERVNRKTCETHNEKLRLVCLTDKTFVCDDCVFDGEHKDHDVKPLKKFETEAKEKRMGLQAAVREFDKLEKETFEILDQKRIVLLNLIQEKFQELRWSVIKKEQELNFMVNSLFETEKKTLFKSKEGESDTSLVTLCEEISRFRDALNDDEHFKVMEQDPTKVDMGIGSRLLDEQMQNLDKKFNKFTNSFYEQLFNFTDSFNQLNFEKLLPYNNSNNEDSCSRVNNRLFTALSTSRLAKEIDINSSSGTLMVSIGSLPERRLENYEDFIFRLDQWKKVNRVWVKFNTSDSINEHVQILGELFTNLGDLISIKIDLSGKEISDAELLGLFSSFSRYSRTLLDFSIDVGGCRIGDQSLYPLLGEVLPKMGKLKNLCLNLNNTLISDLTLETFAENMLPTVKGLETFDLRLWETKVTDRSITHLFTKMEKVKKFILDLGYTSVTNASILALANNTIPTMRSLEEFKLGLTKTSVSDDSVNHVFDGLETAKSIGLFLHGTNITDKSMDTFARRTLPKLRGLEVFEARLGETKLSDQSILHLFQNMERVKKFVLKVQSTNVTDKMVDMFIKTAYPSMKCLEECDIDVSGTKVSEKAAIQLARLREKFNE